jgi:succinate dehydrogenase / fumarate reductase cytochrome b subunit
VIGNRGAAVLTSDRNPPRTPVRTRPLSPHLGVYRWQIGNTLSILHRATGVALALGLLALSLWLISLAGGEESYRTAERAFASPLGILFLIGWTFAFLYHLLNGVRHLFWDLGLGFERRERHASGWFAVLGSLGLTLGVWAMLWHWARV